MSAWQVAREQWIAWIEDDASLRVQSLAHPLDELDEHLRDRLSRSPFAAGDEETISRPGVADPESFESRATLIRKTIEDEDEDDVDDETRVRREPEGLPLAPGSPASHDGEHGGGEHGGGLEVGLRVPEAGLEISLHPPERAPGWSSPERAGMPPLASVTGETVVAEAPLPEAPSYLAEDAHGQGPPDGPDYDSGLTAADESARELEAADEADDEGLFIPTLTRVAPEPEPLPASDEPPDELPPVISGQTVIGPPPSPPEPDDGPRLSTSASSSSSSGFITSEPDESAQTLIRGEIPTHDEVAEQDQVPHKSKVVIDPSASGVLSTVYDEEEPEDAPLVDDEPDELDAADLMEDEDAEVLEEPEAVPPPAPSRPPPAHQTETATPRLARPIIDVGPPPPPLSSASLDAALGALPAAPAVDEGWPIDAFGEHYGALVSPLRADTAAAEVGFILHCTGLGPGASVLDIGCGDGAHCVGLGARGLRVTGLDASPAQLMRASGAAQAAGVAVELVSGDMRQPPVEGTFDAIVCLGGTLGMFTDEDDRNSLQHMRNRLVPGGQLMLHVLNRDYIVGRLPARSWWQGQGCLVLDEAQIFSPTSRVHVHRTVVFETGRQFEHNIGLRLYGLTELVQLCAQVGLRVLEYSGSRHTRGRFYGATSSEIWLLAQRYDG